MTATGARGIVNSPQRDATEAAVVGELSLQGECVAVIVAKPLPIKDDLLDAGALNELGPQVMLANDTLNLALRQYTIKLGA